MMLIVLFAYHIKLANVMVAGLMLSPIFISAIFATFKFKGGVRRPHTHFPCPAPPKVNLYLSSYRPCWRPTPSGDPRATRREWRARTSTPSTEWTGPSASTAVCCSLRGWDTRLSTGGTRGSPRTTWTWSELWMENLEKHWSEIRREILKNGEEKRGVGFHETRLFFLHFVFGYYCCMCYLLRLIRFYVANKHQNDFNWSIKYR